jgi:hypothetical protein
MQAVDLRDTTLTKLESLLWAHSPELLAGRNIGNMNEGEHMLLLDHAVHFEAGRFAIHQWNSTAQSLCQGG